MADDQGTVKFSESLAALMRSIRESRGMPQEALAVQLGRDQPWISKVENGTRRVQLVEFLSWLDALGMSLTDVSEQLDARWSNRHDG